MIRTIDGFHLDAAGDWVAELSCLHSQHVRHRPPFFDRPWVLTGEGRAARIASNIECPLCDRAELPDGLRVVRTAGPFTRDSVPPALLRDHRIAERTWGRLRVLDGTVDITLRVEPPLTRVLHRDDEHAIPPTALHAVALSAAARFEIDFLTRSGSEREPV